MTINKRVRRLLWSRSGGYCQNPNCRADFFKFFEDGSISSIEELAHIISGRKRGPRGDKGLGKRVRDEYDNIILLCPNCHTLIDKNPGHFPVDLLLTWKSEHEQKIKDAFVVPVFKNRESLSKEVHRILRRNKRIYEEYGPHSVHALQPLSDAVTVWYRYILSDILPNNRQIAKLLLGNEHLLKEEEKATLEKFIIHREAFEYNHISGDKTSSAPLFPDEMNSILED